jgi:UDP-GlcNAc:undecaprenyl-phosphate/decaprenyl-phosphate GlcNAc-1-phosphate transferase
LALRQWLSVEEFVLATAIILVAVTSTLVGCLSVYLVRQLAVKLRFVDRPDGGRKLQLRPVALCGGLGVLIGATLSLLVCMAIEPRVFSAVTQQPEKTLALLVGATIIAIVGLIDDLITLRARHKLLGQIAASLILIIPGGYVISTLSCFGESVELGYFSIPITLFWFLAAINAINLLDGMDGLLGTVGVIIFGSVAGMSLGLGSPFAGFVAVAMAGAILGFLYFNLPPATVYLGDCGSMLIGLTVAALTLTASLKGPAVAIIAPAALLVLPIFDTAAAIIRRKLTGRGLAVADRGHFHHELQRRFVNRWIVLGVAFTVGSIGSAGALLGTFFGNDLYAIAAALAVVVVLIVTGLFGRAEANLLWRRSHWMVKSLWGRSDSLEIAVQLQGNAEWKVFWANLVRLAGRLQVQSLRLDINAPAWHESFHGRWDRTDSFVSDTPSRYWRVELPVAVGMANVGKMTIVGAQDSLPMVEQLYELTEALNEIQKILKPHPHSMSEPSSTLLIAESVPA